jgi:hypothetical protein
LYDSFDLVAENIGQLSVMSDKERKAPTEFTKGTKDRPKRQSAEKVPWRAILIYGGHSRALSVPLTGLDSCLVPLCAR